MALCRVLSLNSQIPYLVIAQAFANSIPSDNKEKPILTVSYNHKALMTLHYDVAKSDVPGFNFLEFLVSFLSITSHRY